MAPAWTSGARRIYFVSRLLHDLIHSSLRNRVITGTSLSVDFQRPLFACRRLHQLFVQWLDQFLSADRSQILFEARIGRRVVITNRNQQPLMRDLCVADLRQAESLIQFFQLFRVQLLWQEAQEMEPLLS